MPNYILLTGAGFSKNWGGWLAQDVDHYVGSHPKIDVSLRSILARYKYPRGGFEEALTDLRAGLRQQPSNMTIQASISKLESAILEMFGKMNTAFAQITFEPQTQIKYLLRTYLVKFDAIFTLNQDLLMEQHYLDGNVALSTYKRWGGWQIPGMQRLPGGTQPIDQKWSPMEKSRFAVDRNAQPYFKLHGSSNWFENSASERPMLITGVIKRAAIGQHPILEWNYECFKEYLQKPDTRLMVIGYGFGDGHINEAIV